MHIVPKFIVVTLPLWALTATSACSGDPASGGSTSVGGAGVGGGASTGGVLGIGGTQATGSGGSTSGNSNSGGSKAGGGLTSIGGNLGTGGTRSVAQCPQSPPSNATACGNTALSCFYDDCPNTGRQLATCTNGSWSVEIGTSCNVYCVGFVTSKTCAGGEICVIMAGGAISAQCQTSSCGPGPITAACAGASGCSLNYALDAGVTVTCNTCPQGGCP